MNEQQQKAKKLKVLLIVLGVIIIPAIFRILNSGILQSIRNIDIVMIFGLGFATSAFLMILRDYLKLRSK